jgi:ATP-dependent Clp protease ATP-binding subunit ClpC
VRTFGRVDIDTLENDESLMFERYTEQARRALFFARYEASQLGGLSIETEHLLLGLLREGQGLIGRILAESPLSLENVRKDIEGSRVFREKVATSVEMPFSADTKRALQAAADEADGLLHGYIGPEHLLLGLLREESSVSSSILRQNGFELAGVRDQISALLQKPAEPGDFADAAQELEQVRALVDRLAGQLSDRQAAASTIEQISSYLKRLQERFRR